MSQKANRSYQLTIRLAGPIADRVRETAKEDSLSLNQAVVKLLERGAGLDRRPGTPIGNQLERFRGLLSKDEAREIVEAADDTFGKIDPELWK